VKQIVPTLIHVTPQQATWRNSGKVTVSGCKIQDSGQYQKFYNNWSVHRI